MQTGMQASNGAYTELQRHGEHSMMWECTLAGGDHMAWDTAHEKTAAFVSSDGTACIQIEQTGVHQFGLGI